MPSQASGWGFGTTQSTKSGWNDAQGTPAAPGGGSGFFSSFFSSFFDS